MKQQLPFLLVLTTLLPVGAAAQSISANKTFNKDVDFLSLELTVDQKDRLITNDESDRTTATQVVSIYDKNLQLEKTLTLQKTGRPEDWGISKTAPTETCTLIDASVVYHKEGTVDLMLRPDNPLIPSQYYIIMQKSADECWFYNPNDCEHSRLTGDIISKTPRYAFYCRKDNETQSYEYGFVEAQYDIQVGPVVTENITTTTPRKTLYGEIPFIDSDRTASSEFIISQNIFNQDEKYEYIRPVYTPMQKKVDERDYDGDGVNESYILIEHYAVSGFQVVTEDGNVLSTVTFDTPSDNDYFYLDYYKLDDKEYVAYECRHQVGSEYEYITTFYEINKINSSLNKVMTKKQIKVYPNPVRSTDELSVDLPDTDKDCTLTLISNDGKVVSKQQVKAKTIQTKLPMNRIPAGVYQLVIAEDQTVVSSSKVIIR